LVTPQPPSSTVRHARPAAQRPILALGLRTLSALLLATLLLLVKTSGEDGIPLPEALFWRQLIPGVLIFGWLASRGQLHRLRTDRLPIHGRRALIGTINTFFVLGSARLLPLSEATMLNFTTPLFAVVFSAILLREHIGPFRWTAVALGLAGVLIIVGFDTANLPPLGTATGIAGAIGSALVAIQIRSLARTEEAIRVVFWFSAFGALMLTPAALYYGSAHGSHEWLVLGAIGLTGWLTQITATAALRLGTVASVIVMDYTQLFWATLYGWLIFGHLPPAATWIGAPAIIGAGLLVAWREHRGDRAAAAYAGADRPGSVKPGSVQPGRAAP
jgi:drug/metabolite transporter (DMT)-like permease